MHLAKFSQKILSKIPTIFFPKKIQTMTSLLTLCTNDFKSCIKREKIKLVPKSRCARMREAIEKCRKPLPTQTCPSKDDPSDNSSTPKTENASDVYLRSQKAFRLRASQLMKLLETCKNSILSDMRKQLHVANLEDIEDMRKILCSIDKKMKILIELDIKCAHTNKLKLLKLTDQASQSIKVCNKRTKIALKNLENELEGLVDETCCKINIVMETITHCKNCQLSPECLEECVKSMGAQGVKLFDQVDEATKRQIEKLEKAKDDAMSERKLLSKYISKEYQKEMNNLSDELSDYIRRLELKSPEKK